MAAHQAPPSLGFSRHLEKDPRPGPLFEGSPVDEGRTGRSTDAPVHPGLVSFRMDWLDLLAVQGTLKSLLQHHSSKASILWRLAFFTVQLSHPYLTTGKTIDLTVRTLRTQRCHRRLKPFATNRKWGTRREFCIQEGPTGFCLVSVPSGGLRALSEVPRGCPDLGMPLPKALSPAEG